MTDYQLVAVKKPWVPEWLWSIVKHAPPIAWTLTDPPGCEWPGCTFAATCLLDGERRCDEHTPPPPAPPPEWGNTVVPAPPAPFPPIPPDALR